MSVVREKSQTIKTIKLISLILRNFKGIRNFTLDINGNNAFIYGDNEVGKTTIFDAFTWLLFGKDSQNKTDFEIKTLDASGEAMHGLEHSVEATLELNNGKRITLKKVYMEQWTKKRGSAKPTFTGHTTDPFINGVPVKNKDYLDRISEIIDEDIFKLLTSLSYFNEQLHWKERRKLLLEVCGDITDEEVIATDKKLKKLPNILGDRKLEEHRDVIAAKRTEINRELEKIPVRIDEVEQGLSDISHIDKNKTSQEIVSLKEQIKSKEQQISRIENGGEIAEKQKKLAEVDTQILQIKNSLNAKVNEQISSKREKLSKVKNEISDLQLDIKAKERGIGIADNEMNNLQSKMNQLRTKWSETNAEEFSFEQEETCPTCGQSLPAEKLEAAREKALAAFNRDKAQQLQSINEEGKRKKEQVEELKTEIYEMSQKVSLLGEELAKKQAGVEAIESEIFDLQQSLKAPEESTGYKALVAKKEAIEGQIEELKKDKQLTINSILDEIIPLREQVAKLETDLASVTQHEKGLKRIDELKEQEKVLAAEFEKLEEELYLTEEFIRTKVQLLDEKINSKFKYARFKMFEVQINGGLKEVCETTYKGVPYSRGLNNAARINVGLDIINTLSEHYGFRAPIFVDNREAVTKLIDTKAQVISLVVSEKDKKLRVELVELDDKRYEEAV